jgi:RND family efflux transporter MFP subunit
LKHGRFAKLPVVIFALLLAVAVGLWLSRDVVGPLFSDSYAAKSQSSKSGSKKKKRKKGVPVIIQPVGTARDALRIEAIGTARAQRFVTLYSEAEGRIVNFKVYGGETVDKGEVLVELEIKDQLLAVQMAQSKLLEAKRLLGRSERLRKSRVKSLANVQDAETFHERASLELRQAEEALADRTLRAPFAGMVGIPMVEAGDRVTTSTKIINIDDRSTLLVEFDVPERYLARLGMGQAVSAKIPSYPARTFNGTIRRLESRVDPLSRTIRVRAAFPNQKDLLRPGMSFFIEMTLPGPEYNVVPQLALQWDSGQSYVWQVRERKARKVIVRSVRRLDNRILVDGKLKAGDMVVVEGVQRLREGKKVKFKAPSKKMKQKKDKVKKQETES